MDRRAAIAGLATVAFVGVVVCLDAGGATAFAQQVEQPRKQRANAERPRDTRRIVPPEERETLGLNDITWTKEQGKIHRQVYTALENDERPWPRPVGFEGTVFVQVHLKHEQVGKTDSPENKAAIKQLQSSVLSQLTAADFHVEYEFHTVPGLLGYVNRAGLDHLKDCAEVVAVCLDDKPMPKRPPHVTKADLPALKPGDPSTQPAEGRFWGNGGKVDAAAYQAVALHGRVFVGLTVEEHASQPDSPPEAARQLEAESRRSVQAVLSGLTADEFWLQGAFSNHAGGMVNMQGLVRLQNHPGVRNVGLDSRFNVDRPLKGK